VIELPAAPIVDPKCQDGWLVMVRHTQVDENLKGVCYGASDVDLSPQGAVHLSMLAAELARLAPTVIFDSGKIRTRRLAEAVANRLGLRPRSDARIAEFDFGEWELRRWDEIHNDGHDIARLVHEPDTFSPPAGETVAAMRDRVLSWRASLPPRTRILAVSHGGPISALRGSLSGSPPQTWPTLIPVYGEYLRIDLPD
jgi:alpha-ribazole phosphatase